MKISIKEAYEIAQKMFPDYYVEVDVSYGVSRYDKTINVSWKIHISPKEEGGESYYETDNILSVVLSRISVNIEKSKKQPVEDVTIETEEEIKVEEKRAESNSSDNPEDLPF